MPDNDYFLKKGTLFSGEADASPEWGPEKNFYNRKVQFTRDYTG